MVPSFNLNEFTKSAERIRQKALEEGRLIYNPPEEELRALVAREPGVKKTIYDNYVAESEPTSRAQVFTKNSVDEEFGQTEFDLLKQCEEILAKQKLICIYIRVTHYTVN